MTWSSSRHVVMSILAPSQSHHGQHVGAAQDAMRGARGGGVRDPGSQTLPLRPGSRPSSILQDALVQGFTKPSEEEGDEIPKFAIVGKPNVGKSSLVNALLGREQNIR